MNSTLCSLFRHVALLCLPSVAASSPCHGGSTRSSSYHLVTKAGSDWFDAWRLGSEGIHLVYGLFSTARC